MPTKQCADMQGMPLERHGVQYSMADQVARFANAKATNAETGSRSAVNVSSPAYS